MVRETFSNCLPSQRTISEWYKTVKYPPRFNEDSFEALKNGVLSACSEILYINLVFDEICIREMIEWYKSHQVWGYADFGNGGECKEEATQVLVFLGVCINRS